MSALRSHARSGSSRLTVSVVLVLVVLAIIAAFLAPARADQPTGDASAAVETAPVATGGSTDDPAIWVDPIDPSRSLIIGANRTAGIGVYDLTGAERQTIAEDATGVDVRRGFALGGQTVDVVAAVDAGSLRFYTVDAAGHLTNQTVGTGSITPAWPNGGGSINGVCLYQSSLSGQPRTYAFVHAPSGRMAQLELIDNAGKIDVNSVRGGMLGAWDASQASGSTLSNCVADDDTHALYVGEKSVAIWKYGAEPGDSITAPTSVDVPAPNGHFTPNLGGLAIVRTGPGTGYLLASSQGVSDTPEADSFMVYQREGDNEFVRAFHVLSGTVDGCQGTRGIEAMAGDLGTAFPDGVFVCQDLQNTTTGGPSAGQNYKLVPLSSIVDMTAVPVATTTTTTEPAAATTTTTAPPVQPPAAGRSGYWMVGADGVVYAFGDAKSLGDAVLSPGVEAVDLEPTPSGNGYWIVDSVGHVFAMGNARWMGNADVARLVPGEKVTSLSSTRNGNGYWIFTTKGRVLPIGDAVFHGDMSALTLNGPVLDSIPSASGNGYYMVASDGGIFTLGDAKFYGSMGGTKLNAPVQSLVPDGDGIGYWLVASDGGIFSFEANFKGSMGGAPLNKPVTGMVRFGNGYLMVAEDGGIFNFSDKAFFGSLGDHPPARPIVSVAALDTSPAPAF